MLPPLELTAFPPLLASVIRAAGAGGQRDRPARDHTAHRTSHRGG